MDLETGARGFVITRKERFLEPWRRPGGRFRTARRSWCGLTDDARQRRRARAIAAPSSSYLRDYSIPLVAAARRGDPSASSVVVTAAGKRRVDALRAAFDSFVATERALVAARQENADDDARTSGRRRGRGARRLGRADPALLGLPHAGDRAARSPGGRDGRPARRRRPQRADARDRDGRDRRARAGLQHHGAARSRRATRISAGRARGWSPRATRPAAGSSATCTTARSSGSSRWGSSCAPRRRWRPRS